jgi:hypothetical protein
LSGSGGCDREGECESLHGACHGWPVTVPAPAVMVVGTAGGVAGVEPPL